MQYSCIILVQYKAYAKADVMHVAFGDGKIRISVPGADKRTTTGVCEEVLQTLQLAL